MRFIDSNHVASTPSVAPPQQPRSLLSRVRVGLALVVAFIASAAGCAAVDETINAAIDELVVELLWDGNGDLDLTVVEPGGTNVGLSGASATGGVFSGDARGGPGSREVVEWTDGAQAGEYEVKIRNWSTTTSLSYRLELSGGGTGQSLVGSVAPGQTVSPASMSVGDGVMTILVGGGGTGGGGTGGGGTGSVSCQAQWQPTLSGTWRATSMVIAGSEIVGTGANDYAVTFTFGSTSYREYRRRNNGSGTIDDYVGTYSVGTDAAASLISGNRCSIQSSWRYNGGSTGSYTQRILSYSGGVLEILNTTGIRYRLVKQ